MEDTLVKILKIADLSQEEMEDFIETFYKTLGSRALRILITSNSSLSKDMSSALRNSKDKTKKIKLVLDKARSDTKIKENIDAAIDEVLDKLVDTIAKSATEEQKQNILAILAQ